MEEELKKDHAEMQAAVDSKQKIIDAQVGSGLWPFGRPQVVVDLGQGRNYFGMTFSVIPHCKS